MQAGEAKDTREEEVKTRRGQAEPRFWKRSRSTRRVVPLENDTWKASGTRHVRLRWK